MAIRGEKWVEEERKKGREEKREGGTEGRRREGGREREVGKEKGRRKKGGKTLPVSYTYEVGELL